MKLQVKNYKLQVKSVFADCNFSLSSFEFIRGI